jgi:hypothetical protein
MSMTDPERHEIESILRRFDEKQEKRLNTFLGAVLEHNQFSENTLNEIKSEMRSLRLFVSGDGKVDGATTRLRLLEVQSSEQRWALRTAATALIGAMISMGVSLFLWLVKGQR